MSTVYGTSGLSGPSDSSVFRLGPVCLFVEPLYVCLSSLLSGRFLFAFLALRRDLKVLSSRTEPTPPCIRDGPLYSFVRSLPIVVIFGLPGRLPFTLTESSKCSQ